MAALPDPYKTLRAAMEKMAERIRRLEQRSPFYGTGMHANGTGGMDSDSYVAGTSGYSFHGDGNFEVNQITARGGIIGNDMLTSPTSPQSPYDYTTNFAVTTTLTNIRTLTIPVPAGFTSAAVTLTVGVYAINSTAGLDYLYAQANINGYNGLAMPVPASASGGSCKNVSTFSGVLPPGILGSSLVLQAAAMTSFATWAANASNQLDISASIVWYR